MSTTTPGFADDALTHSVDTETPDTSASPKQPKRTRSSRIAEFGFAAVAACVAHFSNIPAMEALYVLSLGHAAASVFGDYPAFSWRGSWSRAAFDLVAGTAAVGAVQLGCLAFPITPVKEAVQNYIDTCPKLDTKTVKAIPLPDGSTVYVKLSDYSDNDIYDGMVFTHRPPIVTTTTTNGKTTTVVADDRYVANYEASYWVTNAVFAHPFDTGTSRGNFLSKKKTADTLSKWRTDDCGPNGPVKPAKTVAAANAQPGG